MSLRAKDTTLVKRARVFTVVGPHEVFAKRRGEVLEVELTDSQADALILGGHVVEKSATKAVEATPAEEAPTKDAVTHTEDMTVLKISGAEFSAQDKK